MMDSNFCRRGPAHFHDTEVGTMRERESYPFKTFYAICNEFQPARSLTVSMCTIALTKGWGVAKWNVQVRSNRVWTGGDEPHERAKYDCRHRTRPFKSSLRYLWSSRRRTYVEKHQMCLAIFKSLWNWRKSMYWRCLCTGRRSATTHLWFEQQAQQWFYHTQDWNPFVIVQETQPTIRWEGYPITEGWLELRFSGRRCVARTVYSLS